MKFVCLFLLFLLCGCGSPTPPTSEKYGETTAVGGELHVKNPQTEWIEVNGQIAECSHRWVMLVGETIPYWFGNDCIFNINGQVASVHQFLYLVQCKHGLSIRLLITHMNYRTAKYILLTTHKTEVKP